MKKIGIALILSIVILAAAYMIAYAATSYTTCQTLYNELRSWEKEAVVCHTVSIGYLHDPNRATCLTNGTRSVALYNGYKVTLGELYCKPLKTYVTSKPYSTSYVKVYKNGVNTDFGRINCKYPVTGGKSCEFSQARYPQTSSGSP